MVRKPQRKQSERPETAGEAPQQAVGPDVGRSESATTEVNDAAVELQSRISALQISEQSSASAGADGGAGAKGAPDLDAPTTVDGASAERSKEEVIAERKAKAAEAKARKAAAKAKKRDTRAGEIKAEAAQWSTPEVAKHGEPKDSSLPAQSALKPAETVRPSASGPFRRVHFASATEKEWADGKDKGQEVVHAASDDASENDVALRPLQRTPLTEIPGTKIHSAFLQFAERCEKKRVIGVDAICVGFIDTFLKFLESYTVSGNQNMSRDLEQAMRPQLSYLTENGAYSFPLALGNLIRQLKREILELSPDTSEADGKKQLGEWLTNYQNLNFALAPKSISSFCIRKLQSVPCLLTYSWCPVVSRIIWDAYETGLRFRVSIIDSQEAGLGGLQLAKLLCQKGIECSYGTFTAIDYLVRKSRIVLLGCSAIFKNGFVVADRGSSQVALVASSYNVPVLVAAQSCKFVDMVQSFSLDLHEVTALMRKRQETIPADLITAVVTEIRILPPSSAPAVLKSKKLEI